MITSIHHSLHLQNLSVIISVARPRSSMDRVTDFESGGCAFDPRRGHFFFLFMTNPQADLQLIRMLSDRLERISADSVWAQVIAILALDSILTQLFGVNLQRSLVREIAVVRGIRT